MKLSKNGATFMRLHEGFVGKWYLDPVGIPTIGIGFTWRSAAFRVWWAENKPGMKFQRGATMTRSEAERALRYLVDNEYGKAVNRFISGTTVEQHVFDGMVSPVYNLGAGALKWKWAKAIKEGHIAEGARRLKTTGVTAQGVKLPGLVRRRSEEALLISDGVYTGVTTLHTRSQAVKPSAMADGVLQRGESGSHVAKLLRDLNRLNYYHGILDDVFGFGAEASVLEFQRDNSIDVDGKAGPETLKAIARNLSNAVELTPQPSSAEGWFMKFLKGLMK